MSEAAEKLKAALLELPVADRLEMLDFISASLPAPPNTAADDPNFDALLQRRIEDLESGRVKGRTGRTGDGPPPPEILEMKAVILHPDAETEVEQAADYYEANRAGYGELFREEVADALARIGSTPTAFSTYKGGTVRRRLITRFGYGVYFLERDDAIYVLAVANQRRQPDYWLDRLNDV